MNNSIMPGRCTWQVPEVSQTQQTLANGILGTRDAERRLIGQRIHQGLNVHLDPVLLDQVQDE